MSRVFAVLLFAAFAGIALAVYRPALHGPFLSDDYGYIVANPYTASLAPGPLLQLFDPTGPARLHTANYAPVHLLLTALERQIFANDVTGYHLINVLCHAFAGWLFAALLLRAQLPAPVAVLAGFAIGPMWCPTWSRSSATSASSCSANAFPRPNACLTED